MKPTFCICIMAGGSGDRFWPLSRQRTPKHLLRLFSEHTLIEETVARVQPLVAPEHLFILTNQAQVEATRQALPSFPQEQIIAEPAKRDTAPACALGTALARRLDSEAVVAFLPADARITPQDIFVQQLKEAASFAAQEKVLVTFSITPSFAATGFGYLEYGEKRKTEGFSTSFFKVLRFVEKPEKATAEVYLSQGNFDWNAGIFLWSVSTFLKEARRSAPALADWIEASPASKEAFFPYLQNTFAGLEKISVDYALMEKAQNVVAAQARFDWDDVGTWTSLPNHLGSDEQGNTVQGKALLQDCHHMIIISPKRTIALRGVHDLVVVDTEDALLICHRDEVQKIKEFHSKLPEELR